MSHSHLIIYTDGGARGNPGPAAGAAVLFLPSDTKRFGEQVGEAWKYFPHATNNVAEYTGIIVGLKKAQEMGAKILDVRMDSELAMKQLNGVYRVKNPDLQILWREAKMLAAQFQKVTFSHVRREQNVEADALVNKIIDAQGMV